MQRSLGFASLLAGLTVLATAAAPLAQTAPGASGGPTIVKGVTVTAGRPPLKDLSRAVFEFVRSHGAPT